MHKSAGIIQVQSIANGGKRFILVNISRFITKIDMVFKSCNISYKEERYNSKIFIAGVDKDPRTMPL